MTVNGKSMGENCENKEIINKDVIKSIEKSDVVKCGIYQHER